MTNPLFDYGRDDGCGTITGGGFTGGTTTGGTTNGGGFTGGTTTGGVTIGGVMTPTGGDTGQIGGKSACAGRSISVNVTAVSVAVGNTFIQRLLMTDSLCGPPDLCGFHHFFRLPGPRRFSISLSPCCLRESRPSRRSIRKRGG